MLLERTGIFLQIFFSVFQWRSPRKTWKLDSEQVSVETGLWGSLSGIHWSTTSCKKIWVPLICWWCSAYFLFFTILQPRCSPEWEQTWLKPSLQWTWQRWQPVSKCSYYSISKSSLHSEITSFIKHNYKLTPVMIFFKHQNYGDIQGDWRVPSSRTWSKDRMNFLCAVQCTASFFIKHASPCYGWLLWYMTGKIWNAYLGSWICLVHIKQHNTIQGYNAS